MFIAEDVLYGTLHVCQKKAFSRHKLLPSNRNAKIDATTVLAVNFVDRRVSKSLVILLTADYEFVAGNDWTILDS